MTAILVVDDADADRDLLATILRPTGYQVLEAGCGEQALRLAHERQPALIIADILMQTMDGYELVRALRNDEATARGRSSSPPPATCSRQCGGSPPRLASRTS